MTDPEAAQPEHPRTRDGLLQHRTLAHLAHVISNHLTEWDTSFVLGPDIQEHLVERLTDYPQLWSVLANLETTPDIASHLSDTLREVHRLRASNQRYQEDLGRRELSVRHLRRENVGLRAELRGAERTGAAALAFAHTARRDLMAAGVGFASPEYPTGPRSAEELIQEACDRVRLDAQLEVLESYAYGLRKIGREQAAKFLEFEATQIRQSGKPFTAPDPDPGPDTPKDRAQ